MAYEKLKAAMAKLEEAHNDVKDCLAEHETGEGESEPEMENQLSEDEGGHEDTDTFAYGGKDDAEMTADDPEEDSKEMGNKPKKFKKSGMF
jgi:hypothetical protein